MRALRVGSSEAPPAGAEAVRWLQEALHLSVDGEFGPETEAAVRRLQARHGLTVDGIVGPETWGVIGVSDDGSGLPPDLAAAPFEPKRRGHSASAGAGLGLSVAHGIVVAHGGQIHPRRPARIDRDRHLRGAGAAVTHESQAVGGGIVQHAGRIFELPVRDGALRHAAAIEQ